MNHIFCVEGDDYLFRGGWWVVALCRVKRVTKMTEKVAIGVLSGVVKVSGYFTGSVANSKAGKKFFGLLPGELAIASLDGFSMSNVLISIYLHVLLLMYVICMGSLKLLLTHVCRFSLQNSRIVVWKSYH